MFSFMTSCFNSEKPELPSYSEVIQEEYFLKTEMKKDPLMCVCIKKETNYERCRKKIAKFKLENLLKDPMWLKKQTEKHISKESENYKQEYEDYRKKLAESLIQEFLKNPEWLKKQTEKYISAYYRRKNKKY